MISGRQIGGYQIQEELGRGAMGVVFKARQLSMDRIVAIKFLPKRLAKDERIVARFLREARAAGQLAHPNIVSVHELGIADGLHFIAMEYVDGNSIHKRIKEKGPFSERDSLDIASQIAEALKVAHARGILHRDIKPDNFLIDSAGRVRLADLGLASIESATADDGGLTQDGTTLGTPHFMSPEQCSGTDVDARSDLYSLGASLFVMATGRTPYEGTTAAAVMVRVLTEPPLSLKKLRPELSPGFVALVEKMMHKDPSKRFQNAGEVADAIQLCKSGIYKGAALPKLPAPARVTGKIPPNPKAAGKENITGQVGTRQFKSENAKWLSLALAGGAAVVVLLALFLMRPGKSIAEKPRENSVVASTEPLVRRTIIDTTTAATPSPVHAEEPKSEDLSIAPRSPEHLLVQMSRALSNGKLRPEEVRRRLKNFREKHLRDFEEKPDLRAQLMTLEKLVDTAETQQGKALRGTAREWTELSRSLEGPLDGEARNSAFDKLAKFAARHELDAPTEKAHALDLLNSMLKDILDSAEASAERNNLPEALDTVRSITAALPAPQAELLQAARTRYEERLKANQEFADFYGKVVDKFTRFDPITKTRFRCEDAARFAADEGPKLRLAGNAADAAELRKVLDALDKTLAALRDQVNSGAKPVELPSLNNFPGVRLTHWDEKGLTFYPRNINQAQPFSWELPGAPDTLLAVVQEALRKAPAAPQAQWDIAALALTLGNLNAAGRAIRDASSADSTPRPLAALARRLLKPELPKAEKSPLEDEARQLFEKLQDAQKAGDRDKLSDARRNLTVKYADTEFVKAHRSDIEELSKPAVAVAEPAKSDPAKIAPAAVKPEVKEKEDIERLKAAGWTEVEGSWAWDGRAFRVDGIAAISVAALEGDITVEYQFLDPSAKIRILTRVDKGALSADKFLQFGALRGPGFGLDLRNDHMFAYLDCDLKRGVTAPFQYHHQSMDPRSFHTAAVAHHAKELRVSVDNVSKLSNYSTARNTGEMWVVVSGPMLVIPKLNIAK